MFVWLLQHQAMVRRRRRRVRIFNHGWKEFHISQKARNKSFLSWFTQLLLASEHMQTFATLWPYFQSLTSLRYWRALRQFYLYNLLFTTEPDWFCCWLFDRFLKRLGANGEASTITASALVFLRALLCWSWWLHYTFVSNFSLNLILAFGGSAPLGPLACCGLEPHYVLRHEVCHQAKGLFCCWVRCYPGVRGSP